jgi:hypothetical protein
MHHFPPESSFWEDLHELGAHRVLSSLLCQIIPLKRRTISRDSIGTAAGAFVLGRERQLLHDFLHSSGSAYSN